MAAHENLGAQFNMKPQDAARLEGLYGSGDVEGYFKGHEVGAPPHPKHEVKSKQGLRYDRSAVHEAIRQSPPELTDIDPRTVHSTQPGLTRGGVQHYMGDTYHQTGETYADQGNAGNRYPVVVEQAHPDGSTKRFAISGHHRAAAALLKGENMRGILVRGQSSDLTKPPFS